MQEEKRRQVGQADLVIEPTALYVNNSNSKGFQGHQGWNQVHQSWNQGVTHGNQSGKNGNSRKERPVCTYCGIVGHIADKCYKLHGYPPGYKHKGKASANQVSSNANGSYGSFFFNNNGFGNVGSQPMQSFANQHDQMHHAPQLTMSQPTMSQPQFNAPQCPITQSQCEQLLSFLASKSNAYSQPPHQAASVLSPLNGANATAETSSSTPYLANFSGNPFWLPPNFTHSIFSAHIVDRHAHKANEWIIDTGASDHMVHSVSCLSSITSTINTFVYLPNGEKALVTHIGTVHISDQLTLYGVLCVPSFTFNLISVT